MKLFRPFLIVFLFALAPHSTSAAEQIPSTDELISTPRLTPENYTPVDEVHKKQDSPRMKPKADYPPHHAFQPGMESFIMDIMFILFFAIHLDD